MHVGYVRVFVSDFQRALDFYTQTLGLALVHKDDRMGWGQFDTGQASLAIERSDPNEEADDGKGSAVGRFIGVTLVTKDLNAVYTDLMNKGVEFTHRPERMPWGGLLADMKDPDGNILTLLEEPR